MRPIKMQKWFFYFAQKLNRFLKKTRIIKVSESTYYAIWFVKRLIQVALVYLFFY